jgi:hypothetical protein
VAGAFAAGHIQNRPFFLRQKREQLFHEILARLDFIPGCLIPIAVVGKLVDSVNAGENICRSYQRLIRAMRSPSLNERWSAGRFPAAGLMSLALLSLFACLFMVVVVRLGHW